MKYIVTLLALLLPTLPAHADDDHDLARRAVEEGRTLPLKDILTRAEAAYPGRLIEAELDDEDGILVYEIKLLQTDGRVVKLYYDAASGQLMKVKAKSRDRHR